MNGYSLPPYTCLYITTDNLTAITDDYGKIHFFERAAMEILQDDRNGRIFLMVIDAAGDEIARCFPLREPVADWERFTGYEAPEELKEVVA